MDTIAWIGFSQSLFAAILMLTKKDNSLPDKILSGWLTLLAIEFLTCAIDHEIFGQSLLSSSFLLFNPALFLYVNSLTRPNFRLKWIHLLHLLPFVVFELMAYIALEPFEMDKFFVRDDNFIYRLSFGLANFVSWTVYNPLSMLLVHKHRISLQNEQSNIEKNDNLGWVLSVSIFYVLYCVLAAILGIVVYFSTMNPHLPHIYNYSVLLFLIYLLSFYGLRQRIAFSGIEALGQDDVQIESSKPSNLNEETKELIKVKLLNYFEEEKAYLNPDLSMDLLASLLQTPKYHITEVLNADLGMNFFRFVNSYRVEAVKEMLTEPALNYSIEAIGYECGFASKSAFYSCFKDVTGYTPVAYRKTLGL